MAKRKKFKMKMGILGKVKISKKRPRRKKGRTVQEVEQLINKEGLVIGIRTKGEKKFLMFADLRKKNFPQQ